MTRWQDLWITGWSESYKWRNERVGMNDSIKFSGVRKVVMQGKLIAVVYTLRTYWNQFSLGKICKQE